MHEGACVCVLAHLHDHGVHWFLEHLGDQRSKSPLLEIPGDSLLPFYRDSQALLGWRQNTVVNFILNAKNILII